jgi:L-alanine-DL-glutamate epimerase-like enolase superfamily enzyme
VSDPLRVTVWRAPTPLAAPVLTPMGPYDTFFHAVVVIEDDDGRVGWGYSGLATLAILDETVARARALLAARPITLDALLTIEQFEETWPGARSDTAGKAAANAISLAAWDLAARRLDVACADLWGRRANIDALDSYASGFFLDVTPDGLVGEAKAYRRAGFRYVKMRVGLDAAQDADRFADVATIFDEPATIAVDAVNSWQPADAREFVERVDTPLLWVEDATPYPIMGALADLFAPIAAGESLETLGALRELAANARLDYALLDVQRLGGPLRFLAVAHTLAAQGIRIGSHIYTAPSAHLMACVDDPLPVEVFDWSDPLFVTPPAPRVDDGKIAVIGPGFGTAVNVDNLQRYGEAFIARS